jgi:hypothetical protein
MKAASFRKDSIRTASQSSTLAPPTLGESHHQVNDPPTRDGYTVPTVFYSFDCSRSTTRRAISADAASGIGNTELTLISPST